MMRTIYFITVSQDCAVHRLTETAVGGLSG